MLQSALNRPTVILPQVVDLPNLIVPAVGQAFTTAVGSLPGVLHKVLHAHRVGQVP